MSTNCKMKECKIHSSQSKQLVNNEGKKVKAKIGRREHDSCKDLKVSLAEAQSGRCGENTWRNEQQL